MLTPEQRQKIVDLAKKTAKTPQRLLFRRGAKPAFSPRRPPAKP